jgi:hypothetical protein
MKKDFQPEQKPNNEPLHIDSTSSPNCTKRNVICSQSQKEGQSNILFSIGKLEFYKGGIFDSVICKMKLQEKSNLLSFEDWLHFVMSCAKNVKSFYEWFDETYKSKRFSIVAKVGNGFYFDESQMRDLYLLMSSNPKVVIPPSKSKTTDT